MHHLIITQQTPKGHSQAVTSLSPQRFSLMFKPSGIQRCNKGFLLLSLFWCPRCDAEPLPFSFLFAFHFLSFPTIQSHVAGWRGHSSGAVSTLHWCRMGLTFQLLFSFYKVLSPKTVHGTYFVHMKYNIILNIKFVRQLLTPSWKRLTVRIGVR